MNKPEKINGFIAISRELFDVMFSLSHVPLTEREAIVVMYSKMNYKEATCRIRGKNICCKRGESIISITTWSKIFGWERGRTRHFINKLVKINLISIIPHTRVMHIRMTHYPNGLYEADNQETDELFQQFWDEYHATTQTRKVNVGRARKEWNLLTQHEKKLAVTGIDNYYYYLTDTRFCKQAVNYLKDKSFLDED